MRSILNQSNFYFQRSYQNIETVAASVSRGLSKNWIIRLSFLIMGIVLIGFLSRPAVGAEQMDTEADKLLRTMSNYMGKLSAFSAKADVDNEIIDLAGQKLQFSSSVDIVVKRPGNL